MSLLCDINILCVWDTQLFHHLNVLPCHVNPLRPPCKDAEGLLRPALDTSGAWHF
jgi:transcriptional regulator of aromatic amino acid metabolism